MKSTRKSGKEGRAKGPGKKTAAGTRLEKPATTKRGKTADALKESEEKYKLLIEGTNTSYVIVDEQGRVLDANEEYIKITGHHSLEKIAGRAVTEWTASYDLERNAAEIRKCVKSGSVRNLVIDYVGPQGRVTPVEINATVLRGPGPSRIFTVCRDITERKRAEEALLTSESRYKAIVENQSEFVVRYLAGGILTFVNDTLCRYIGMKCEDLLGRSYYPFMHPDDREAFIRKIEALDRRNPVMAADARVVLPDGRVTWHRWTHQAIFDARGKIAEYQSTGRDVTDIKEAEDRLRASEGRFRALFENLNVVALVMDPSDGRILDANDAAATYYGWPRERLRSMLIWEINTLPPDELLRRMDQVKSRKKASFLLQHRRADGSVRDVEVYSGPIPFGGRTALYSVIHDVTERKLAEEALRLSEERFRTAFQTSPDAVMITRLADGMCVSVNKGFTEITGYTEQEVIGRTTLELNIWDDPEARKKMAEDLRSTGAVRNLEARFRTKTGKNLYALMSASVVDIDGIPHLLSVTRDITERRQAEVLLRESEEKFSKIFKQAPLLITLSEVDTGRYFDVNEKFLEISGFNRVEVIGRTAIEIGWISAGQRTLLLQALREDGRVSGIEFSLRRKDGRAVVCLYNGEMITVNGKQHLLSIAQDITERKRAEEEIAERGAMQQQIMDTASVAIFLVDKAGRITQANRCMVEMFGRATDDLVGRKYVELVHPSEREDGRAKMLALLSSKIPSVDLERHYWRKDGTEFWGHLAGRRFYDVHGNELGLIGVISDITERKQAEARIKESEKKYRTLFESSTDGIFILDLQGNFIDANPAAYARLGYTREELLSMNIGMLDTPEYADKIPGRLKQLREQGVAVFESAIRRKDGSVMQIEVSARLLEYGGKPALVSVNRDITERKRVEEELREKETRYRTLFEAANDGIFIQDSTGFRDCNQRGAEMYGLPKEKIIGRLPSEFAPERQPDGRLSAVVAEEKVRAALNGVPQVFEWQPLRADRKLFDVEITLSRLDLGGELCLQAIVRDITERKRAEEALRENEERFRAITMTASDAILLMDDKGRIIYWNPAAERIFGYSTGEALGKELHTFLAPQRMHEHYQKGFAFFTKTGQGPVVNKSVEMMAKRRDGTEFPIEVSTSAMNIGGQWHALGIVRDITERKLAEASLRQSEERFRDLAQSLPLTVFEMDLQGRVTYVNRAGLEQFGYSQQDIDAGVTMVQVISPGDHDRAREVMARRLAENSDGYAEYQGLRKNGTTFPITVASSPILRDGRPVGLRGIVVDLTERKLLEEERLKAQKLESIGTLAGGIAHDFNNLLQGIFGYISMAKLTIDQREKSLAMLGQAEKALHQSVNLTSQLLTFSKGGKPVKKIVDLREVIENAVKFALSGSRVTYDLSLSDDLCAVEADAGQIGQVVQNIVLNAEQAMPLGGRIEIAARNVPASRAAELPLAAPDGLVEIVVRDQGTGIPPEHLPRIFDPYFTTKEKGSGLGLATSYSIIKNHDGMISVSSELGTGSTFTVYLPASRAEQEQAAASAGRVACRKGRVLVMDDEDMVRVVAGELLRELGHEAVFAEDGDSAIEKYTQAKAEGRPFDVVILDLTIRGGKGGAETMRELREIDSGVKAVVSSGYSDDEVIATYHQHGFRSFLKKPYDIQELGRILDDVMA